MPLATALDLENFHGPLDLLLMLIEKRRLEITEVSLVTVTDQYLEAVRTMPTADAEVLAEFLDIATRLLLLKSRALLPRSDEPEEEPEDDLPRRLEEYRRFKAIAQTLAGIVETGEHAYPHAPRPDLQALQPPLAPIEAEILGRLWRSVLRRGRPAAQDTDPLTPRVQVAERVSQLRGLLALGRPLQWEWIAGATIDEVIATFLAVLELVRRGELHVQQDRCFGPIVLAPSGTAIASKSEAIRS